jgi:hypothetical protein
LLALLGCGSSSLPAVVPILGDADEEAMPLRGTVEAIRFQNINKARGRYTFNVELLVAHEGIAESPHEQDQARGTFRVRVHKVYWGELDADERSRLAPDGPTNEMHVDAWKGYEVGEAVDLQVVSWGPSHGALVGR